MTFGTQVSPDGLQPARTRLAWQRTALAAAACSLLLFHGAAHRDWDSTTVPAVLAAITAAVLAVTGRYRDRQLRTAPRPAPAGGPMIAGVAVLVTLTSTITLVSLL
ncbi:protein of unknown function [Amycolatopsis marina]|uniref:DUF202 domain-containing protein n=1 Tax=Amycolatopsis marina TaxID=490629 RepID=A0A1I0WSW4_9PSEU|nr:DUF202 domain-containing protein [Amycolatopsis marina]SFA91086.1 protein of unknown function [Amycolatopsis marina]